jgi:hypothetical protein
MNANPRELLDVLATFTTRDCARAVALARRLIVMDGVSLSTNESGVPTNELQEVYSDRALDPFLPKVLAREYRNVARLAAQYPLERWYIISVSTPFHRVVVFANEQGIGRYCLDRAGHSLIVAVQPHWNISSIARYLYEEYQGFDDVKLLESELIVSTSEDGFLHIQELPEEDMSTGHKYRDRYQSNLALPEEFRHDVVHLSLFRIYFNDVEPTRRLLKRLAQVIVESHERAWIDTNYQSVISAQDFLVRIDADPDWDWTPLPSSA